MKPFLETLNYSSSNEDSNSELRALGIGEGDSVLCITGSGGRTLDLLTQGPKEVISIDFNPCQNFLLELKTAAIQHLRYEEFLEFMGIHNSQKRGMMYKDIRPLLSTGARTFWDNHLEMISDGVIYQGRWEKYFRGLARLVSFTRSNLRDRLFACRNITEQARIWHEEWDNFFWRMFLLCISSRTVWRTIFGDPGFYEHIPEGFSISKYLNQRFASASENILFNESPFLTLLFYGRYHESSSLPVYLLKENYLRIRDHLPSIRMMTQSLSDYLDQCEKRRFKKYSLSDFSSYTNGEEYVRIWKGIIRTALSGAIICERQSLVKRDLPFEARPFVKREMRLETDLSRTDNSCFYTFMVGSIDGAYD